MRGKTHAGHPLLDSYWFIQQRRRIGLCVATAQAAPTPDPAPRPFSITRADPTLDALIAPDAKLTTVAAGFGFIDGPVWIRGRNGAEGYLLASSIIDNVVYKVTAAGKVSVFLDRAGYTGEDFANAGKFALIGRAHVLLMGPGCTGVDGEGRVVWCAGQDRAIMRLEKDGTRTVLTKDSEGKRFNGPNDVAIAADGAIFSLFRMLVCAAASTARSPRCPTPSGDGKTASSPWR